MDLSRTPRSSFFPTFRTEAIETIDAQWRADGQPLTDRRLPVRVSSGDGDRTSVLVEWTPEFSTAGFDTPNPGTGLSYSRRGVEWDVSS